MHSIIRTTHTHTHAYVHIQRKGTHSLSISIHTYACAYHHVYLTAQMLCVRAEYENNTRKLHIKRRQSHELSYTAFGIRGYTCVCVCVCLCVRAREREFVRLYVYIHVCFFLCV
jgi:hypothetical protein